MPNHLHQLSAAGTQWLDDQGPAGLVGANQAGTTVLGTLLDDARAEPAAWNAPPAKWRASNGRPRTVRQLEALAGGNRHVTASPAPSRLHRAPLTRSLPVESAAETLTRGCQSQKASK